MKQLCLVAAITVLCTSFQRKRPGLTVPACIAQKIKAYKRMQAFERPRAVYTYLYKGKKVYYVILSCCDNFNELYDSNCNLLGHPDGGFTGKGDGRIPDFTIERKAEKLLWKNN